MGIELVGGGVKKDKDGNVTINAPSAKGNGALLFHKNRDPEVENGYLLCSRCKSLDVVIVIDFPNADGEPLKFCRTCMDRPNGRPLTIKFS